MMTPLRQLVAQQLVPFRRSKGAEEFALATFDDARHIAPEALIGQGLGLDLRRGERILVGASYRLRVKGHEHRLALAITDRKLAQSGWSTLNGPAGNNGKGLWVDLHALDGAEGKKAGFVDGAHIALSSGGVTKKLSMPGSQEPLNAFLEALVRTIPKGSRCEPPTPFVSYGENDPIGIESALAGLWIEDPEVRDMLTTLRSNLERGVSTEVGLDLVNRIVLAHRTRASAPMKEGDRWLSPLSAQDFGHTLVRLLGTPSAHSQPQPGIEVLDFQLDPRRDRLADALTGLGVASFVALGVGFNPATVAVNAAMGRKPVTYLRAVFADQPGATGYQLLGRSGALEAEDGVFATRLQLGLDAAAYPVLGARARRGWTPSYEELLAS